MKFRILKCEKYMNLILVMNVFLLAPNLDCVSEIVRGEMSKTERMRTVKSSRAWCH